MAEKLSIAATLFSLQINQAGGKMGETMPNFPTSSEFHPWNEWMEQRDGWSKIGYIAFEGSQNG